MIFARVRYVGRQLQVAFRMFHEGTCLDIITNNNFLETASMRDD